MARAMCARANAVLTGGNRLTRLLDSFIFCRAGPLKPLKWRDKLENALQEGASLPFFARPYSFAIYGFSVIQLVQDSL